MISHYILLVYHRNTVPMISLQISAVYKKILEFNNKFYLKMDFHRKIINLLKTAWMMNSQTVTVPFQSHILHPIW